MSPRAAFACALAGLLGAPADALDLTDSAMLAAEEITAQGTAAIPVGGFDGGEVPVIAAEGAISRRAWHQPLKGQTTQQVFAPLRAQIVAEGFQVILDCTAESCGGFDFRYAIDTLPEPAMHVDLGDFRFVSARRLGAEGPEYVTLMVSRSATRAFVQVTRVGASTGTEAQIASTKTPNGTAARLAADAPLAERLERDGRAVLTDLDFATGAARLSDGSFASLDALARYLTDSPDRSVMLVGHTDAVGALDRNIALSRQRAQAVRRYLVERLGVSANRVDAAGAGFLAPLASNRTEEGRTLNRRVEVILTTVD